MTTRLAFSGAIILALSACAADSIDSSPVVRPPDRRPLLAEPARGSAARAWSDSAEYRRSPGLAGIGAAEAYAARPAGQPGGRGQLIAVIDTGIDVRHPDLTMNRNASFIRDNSVADRAHGTQVAGIAAARRDGVGTHGVAYAARINGIDIFSRNAPPGLVPVDAASEIAAAIGSTGGVRRTYGRPVDALIGGVQSDPELRSDVANISLTLRGPRPGDPALSQVRDAMVDATRAGTLVVAALGNQGTVGPSWAPANLVDDASLRGRAVAVGNWDSTRYSIADVVAGRARQGQIAGSMSNACGQLRNCIFAPGESIVTTIPGGGYGTASGTSMAAPHVAGALAVMKAAFPNVPPEELLNRLFRTAVNPLTLRRGEFDRTGQFGWGLMDLGEAMRAQGALRVATASGEVALESTSLQLGSGFSHERLAEAFTDIVTLDADGFAYRTALAERIGRTGEGRGFLDRLLGRDTGRLWSGHAGPVAMTASLAANEPAATWARSADGGGDGDFLIRVTFTEDTSLSIGRGRGGSGLIDETFGAPGRALFADLRLTNPFKDFAGRGHTMEMRTALGDKTTLGLHSTLPLGEGEDETRGVGLALSHKVTDALVVTGQLGVMSERSGLWGSRGGGGLAIDGGDTRHIALSANYAVSDRLSLSSVYSFGMVDPATSGLLSARRPFSGDAFALGATLRDAIVAGDSLSLTAGLPFRVRSAPVTITAPTGVGTDGALVFEQRTVNLAPEGREKRIGVSYGVQFAEPGVDLDIGALLRFEPDHRRDERTELIVGGGLQWRF